jgi:polysaccharide biosynthesis/export protein
VKHLKIATAFAIVLAGGTMGWAQSSTGTAQTPPGAVGSAPGPVAPVIPAGVPLPAGYVIGPDDILEVLYWRDKDMSAEVAVRPDGLITLPLLNDVQAAGLTPDQLREFLTRAAAKFAKEPNVTVVVKTINSRKVFVMGQVAKPGPYPLSGPTTVMQALAVAGGILEFADSRHILIMRTENGRPVALPFNYKDVLKRKNLKQNIELKPGDTVVVP